MGRDVTAIANHKLNTATMESLATDLAARFNGNVRYGYMDLKRNAEFVVLGEVGERHLKGYTLDSGSMVVDKDQWGAGLDPVYYEFYGEKYDDYNVIIMKDSFQPFISYDNGRWWSFCQRFMGELDYGEYEQEYRREVLKQATFFGGDTAMYIDEQGETFFIFDQAAIKLFSELLAMLKGLSNVVDIDQWVEANKNAPFYYREYPIGFIDYFKTS